MATVDTCSTLVTLYSCYNWVSSRIQITLCLFTSERVLKGVGNAPFPKEYPGWAVLSPVHVKQMIINVSGSYA